MYDKNQGQRRLRTLQREFADLGGAGRRRVVEVRIEVRSASHRILPREDWAKFNAATPYLSIEPGPRRSDRFFLSSAMPPRAPTLGGEAEADVTAENGVVPAIETAQRFLVGLAIAGQGLFVWRELGLKPYSVTAVFEKEDGLHEVDMAQNPVTYQGRPVLHAGFLAGALDTMRCLHEADFPPRFYEIYQRSAELMGAGAQPFTTFFEEAYLGFVRLLEYLVTAKILDCGGSLSKHRFEEAVAILGAKPSVPGGPKTVGNLLLRKRGSAVAHFQKGNVDDRVSVDAVKLAKDVLDMTCCEYVLMKRRTVKAARPPRQA